MGILVEVEERMDPEQCVCIWEDNLLPSIENSGLSEKSTIL